MLLKNGVHTWAYTCMHTHTHSQRDRQKAKQTETHTHTHIETHTHVLTHNKGSQCSTGQVRPKQVSTMAK